MQSSPIDLTVKKKNDVNIVKTEDHNVKDNLGTEPNTSGIVIDLTIGKKPCQPRCKSSDENTNDAPVVAKSSELDCNADFQTSRQDLKPEESVIGTEQVKQVTGGTTEEQPPSEQSSSECSVTVNIPAKSPSSKKTENVLSAMCNNTTVKIHGMEDTKVTSVTSTISEESLARRDLIVVSFGVQTGEELGRTESTSFGVQTSSPDLKDVGCQCDPMLLEPDVKPVISPPMANQFCQTEQYVDDKETQSETVVNATSVNTQTEPKLCVDIALSPVKFDSPIRTHNTIISPIASSTPIKPDFVIRIPEADSVGGPESESILFQENVVSTGMLPIDTSVTNGSISNVKNSDITIDSSNESYPVSTKEIVSPIRAPSSAANVLQHEEIKQSKSTVEVISEKCTENGSHETSNNTGGDASAIMEPTKPLESVHSKDYTLSLYPKVPQVVDIAKNGEEIATCQKNQMKEADTADPTVVTEMRYEGKESAGEEPKAFLEADNERDVSKTFSSSQSPPLVSSPLISSESDSSGATTIGYSDASHRSKDEACESIRQQKEKESTSFNALRSQLVTSTSRSFENVAIKATHGDKEKNEDSSNDEASVNDPDCSMNTTKVDFSKIVVPDSTQMRDENLPGTSLLGESKQTDNNKECEDLANNIKDDDPEGTNQTEASDIEPTDQDRKEILLLLEGSSSQNVPICTTTRNYQSKETATDVIEQADGSTGSECHVIEVDSYVDSDIEVVPQTDSENEGGGESDEVEDREVNGTKSSTVTHGTDEVEVPSFTNSERCSRNLGDNTQNRLTKTTLLTRISVDPVTSTPSTETEKITRPRILDADDNSKEGNILQNETPERLNKHIHCESTSTGEDTVLFSEKIGESSNDGGNEEIKGSHGTSSVSQTQACHTASNAPDTRQGNSDQIPKQSVASLSQSDELPGRTEILDDRAHKPRVGGELLETFFPSPLGGEEVGINQVVSTPNHGIDQSEDLELVEPTQRKQGAGKKGTTAATRSGKVKPNGTKPKNKFDVPFRMAEYPKLGTPGHSTNNTGAELFMSPIVTATENYNSSQPAIGKNSLRNARSSSSIGKTSQCGNEMTGKDNKNIINSESMDEGTGKPSTLDKASHGSEAETRNRDLDDSKGYLSDWVADAGKRNMRIKFSGKTYERVMKKGTDKPDMAEEGLEYELVKMIAFQEDYEYFTSSHDESGVSSSPQDEANNQEYTTRGVNNTTKDHEDGETISEDGQGGVCDEEAGEKNGDDQAEIKIVATFKGETSDDKSMEFERELSQLDNIPNEQHTGTSRREKANRKSIEENLDDTAHGLGQHECDVSRDSVKEFDEAEQYDTAEEYG